MNHRIQVQREYPKPGASCADTVFREWNLLTGKLWTSAAFADIFGYKATTSGDDFWQSCLHRDDKKFIDRAIRLVITGAEKTASVVCSFLCADNNCVRVHCTAEAVIENDLVVRIIGSFTKQTLPETDRQETEDWMPLALDAAELGTWDFDMATGITQYDARCRELTGL